MKTKRFSLLVAILIATVIIAACVRNPVTGKRQFMLYSEAQEIAMGAEYDPQIVASMGIYENPQLQAFLDAKVKELGLVSHRPHIEYHVRLLDSHVVNAFAVPGGYIYLTRGILAHFNNEAELIGVIGHEMGHVTARHTVARMSSQTLTSLALMGGMMASEAFRNYGELAMMGMQLLYLKYSRDDEREADKLGVEYTAKIGYDASKFAEFYTLLQRMQLASDHGGIPTFLSTHPDPGDRYNDVHKDASMWKQELGLSDWKVNAAEYLSRIDGIIYGEDPRQGYVDGYSFYHPEMLFQFNFPPSWILQNAPTNVQIVSPDKKAMLLLMHAEGNSLQDAARKMIEQLKLTLIASDATTLNGFNSIVTMSQLSHSDPAQNQKVRTSFIDIGGKYLAFHAVSLDADFQNFLPYFNTTQHGFKKLTDPSRINVKPDLVRVKRVSSAATVLNILRGFNVPTDMHEEVALLNNLSLTDRVQAGQYIKIIEKH